MHTDAHRKSGEPSRLLAHNLGKHRELHRGALWRVKHMLIIKADMVRQRVGLAKTPKG